MKTARKIEDWVNLRLEQEPAGRMTPKAAKVVAEMVPPTHRWFPIHADGEKPSVVVVPGS